MLYQIHKRTVDGTNDLYVHGRWDHLQQTRPGTRYLASLPPPPSHIIYSPLRTGIVVAAEKSSRRRTIDLDAAPV